MSTPPVQARQTPPRIALVHDWLTGMRGGEKVLEAIAGLFPGAPIFTLFHFEGSVSAALENHPIHTSFLQRAPGLRKHYRRYLPLFPVAIEELDLQPFDLILSTSHCVAKGVIPAPGAFHLCYCHTPMRYAWDQERAYFPRRTGLAAHLRSGVLAALRAWDVASASRVDLFVANSSFVAQRIRRYYGRQAEVLHPPVDVEFFTPPPAPPPEEPDYALMVSALAPYKRVEIAIEACRRLGLTLKIVGDGPERERLENIGGSGSLGPEQATGSAARRAHEGAAEGHKEPGPRSGSGTTQFLGRVGPDALRELYRGALCFLQPGVEDFGIACVEALACGTPVAAAARGGVLDIVTDGVHGALYDEALGTAGLMTAIDKTRRIRSNALDLRQRAEQFSAQRFTERLSSLWTQRPPPCR